MWVLVIDIDMDIILVHRIEKILLLALLYKDQVLIVEASYREMFPHIADPFNEADVNRVLEKQRNPVFVLLKLVAIF